MKNNKALLTATIGAAIFAIIIGAIKYSTQTNITFGGLLVAAIFGGVVSLLAFSKKSGFTKNLVFILALVWIIWAALNPIQTVGGNWVINKTALLLIGAIFIILLEQDAVNSIREDIHKKPRMAIGFFGSLALLLFFTISHVLDPLFLWLGQHLWVLSAVLLIWFAILYFVISKTLNKAGTGIISRLTKGRK